MLAGTRKRTTLPSVHSPDPTATVINVRGSEKAFRSLGDDEDLLCGGCGRVIFEGVSVRSLLGKIVTPGRFIVTCGKCGVHNAVDHEPSHR